MNGRSLNSETIPEKDRTVPEKQLWARVLEQAIREAVDGNQSAIAYIKSNRDRRFGFVWICKLLDMNFLLVRELVFTTGDEIVKRL